MEPAVSIAAVTYRNLPATKAFVDGVKANTSEPYELVIVDNNSPKDVADYLDSLLSLPHFKLIRNKANLGIGVGMNQAMAECTTNYIFRCDSDILIRTPNWTKAMRVIADAHVEVGAVGTNNTGGILSQGPNYLETDLICSNCMLIPRRTITTIREKIKATRATTLEKVQHFLNQPERFADYHRYLEGIKHWALRADGLWDSGWPKYGMDDFDYSYQILWAGLRLAKDDRIYVHHTDDSMREDNKEQRHKDVNDGARYLRTKWEIVEDHWDDPEAPNGKGWKDVWGYLPAHRAYKKRIGITA